METELTSQKHLERILVFRTFPGLDRISPSAVSLMAENSKERFFPKGSEIYSEGEQIDCVHWIIEGRVSLKRQGITYHQVESKGAIGGLSAFAKSDDGPQVIAEEDTWTYELDNKDTDEIFEEHFDLMLLALRVIAADFIGARLMAGPQAGFKNTSCPLPLPNEKLKLVDRISYVSKSLVFAPNRIEVITDLTRESKEIRVPAKTLLWREGDKSGKMLIIVNGGIRCWNDKQEFAFCPGDSVGGLDALAGTPRWYHAEAMNSLIAIEIDIEHVLDVIEDNADLGLKLLGLLSQGLIELRKTFAKPNYHPGSWT